MPRFVTHQVAEFHGRNARDKVPARTSAKWRVLAESLDAAATGNVGLVADLLTSRVGALETSVRYGGRAITKDSDALTDPSSGVTIQEERREDVMTVLLDHKLKRALKEDSPGQRK